TWCGRHRGSEQELDQDHRRTDGEFRAGLFRLRFEEVRLDDDLAFAIRTAADSRAVPDSSGGFRGVQSVPFCRADRCAALRCDRCGGVVEFLIRTRGYLEEAAARLAERADREETPALRH